jgi:hypothetical protein
MIKKIIFTLLLVFIGSYAVFGQATIKDNQTEATLTNAASATFELDAKFKDDYNLYFGIARDSVSGGNIICTYEVQAALIENPSAETDWFTIQTVQDTFTQAQSNLLITQVSTYAPKWRIKMTGSDSQVFTYTIRAWAQKK